LMSEVYKFLQNSGIILFAKGHLLIDLIIDHS